MASIYSLKGSTKQKKRFKIQYDNFGKIQKMSKRKKDKKKEKLGSMPKFPIAGTSKGRKLPGVGSNLNSKSGRKT